MLKKILAMVLVFAFVFSPATVIAQAATPMRLVLNGQPAENLEVAPVIVQDRMMVPVRSVFERLGAIVEWHGASRSVYIRANDRVLLAPVDGPIITVDGNQVEIPVPAQIINDFTMVPVAAVADALGFDVGFRDNTVFVSSPTPPEQTPPEATETSPNTAVPMPEFADIPLPPVPSELVSSELSNSPQVPVPQAPAPEITVNTEPPTLFSPEILPPAPPLPELVLPTQPDIPLGITQGTVTDISPAVPPMHFAPTRILAVQIPSTAEQQAYVISASSPISSVNRMVIEGNRLVVDIPNSVTDISGSFATPPGTPVTEVRVSQFEDSVSRVVFDLQGGTTFSLIISHDRMNLVLAILHNTLEEVSFEAGTEHDTLTLQGVNPGNLDIQPRQGILNIRLNNVQMLAQAAMTEMTLDGNFAGSMSITQLTQLTGVISVAVRDFTAYTIQGTANETVITLHPATYRNIFYDYETRTIRIPKIDGFPMALNGITHSDLYHQHMYILTLPIDASTHLGHGEFVVADHMLRSVNISNSIGGFTQLQLHSNQIIAVVIEEDEENYFIRILQPREKYPRIVVLDAGHGGRFPGAVRGNIRESDLNMIIQRKLIQLIEADGSMRVYTVRNSDVHLSSDHATDLRMRAQFANSVGDIFVSLHHNAATRTTVHGLETFYLASGADQFRTLTSRNLAELIQRHNLLHLGSYDRGVRRGDFSVLRNSQIPAALVEFGFMSNEAELARMVTPEFQWAAARATHNALLEAFTHLPPRQVVGR